MAVLAVAFAATVGPATAGQPSPTGRIAVVCFTPNPLAYQICIVNPDGTSYRQLTHGPERSDSTDPSFSPNGKSIVFVRGPNQGKTGVYVMRSDGTHVRPLTHCGDCYGEDTPAYSPDGRTIAFHRDPRSSRGGIFIMRADGSGLRQLTRETCDCYDGEPSFAPDGRRLVFVRVENTTKRQAIFTVATTSGPTTRITDWALGASDPDWSPNDKLIVFNSHGEALRAGVSRNLYTIRPDGSGMHALTHADNGIEQNEQPSWSPDGHWIAFTREPNAQTKPSIHGDQDVDIMRADGTEIRRIAAPPKGGHSVDWGR